MYPSRKQIPKKRPDPATLPIVLPNLTEIDGLRAGMTVLLINTSHKYSSTSGSRVISTKIIRPEVFSFMLESIMKFDNVAIKTDPSVGPTPIYSFVFIKPAEKGNGQIQATAIQFIRQNIPEELAGKFYLTLESFRNRSNIEAVLFGAFVE